MAKRIIIAGGGTGGHIFPALAIANALKKEMKDVNILFVGAKGKMEMERVPQAGYEIKGIDIAGFNRSSLIKNVALPLKLVKSFVQVKRILNEFKPDAAIGVGGYSSFPVLKYAQAKGIKTFLHESNSFAGKSNILLSKKATKVFVASDGMERFFPSTKIIVSGNPVRPEIEKVQMINRKSALDFFGLDAGKKTLLIVGGSLGAKSINESIYNGLELLVEKNMIQLIWQTGRPYLHVAKKKVEGRQNVWVNDFIKQMEQAYAAADVIISRSGAMATSELCIVQKPVLFVPYPFAAEDHQTANAQKLVYENAAIMIADKDANELLVNETIKLINDNEKQMEMKQNISKFAKWHADEFIAKQIIKLLDN